MVRLPAPRMRSFIRVRKALKSAIVSVMARNIPRLLASVSRGVVHDLAVALRLPLWPCRCIADGAPQVVQPPENHLLLLSVDLVGRVRRLMIVGVHAVEEEQDGHALAGEVVVI